MFEVIRRAMLAAAAFVALISACAGQNTNVLLLEDVVE